MGFFIHTFLNGNCRSCYNRFNNNRFFLLANEFFNYFNTFIEIIKFFLLQY